MYQQTYDPLDNVFFATLVAAIPILKLLYFIALGPIFRTVFWHSSRPTRPAA